MPVTDRKLYTVEEANDLLPKLRPLLVELREALQEYRFHSEQVQDLERMWPARELDDASNRDHEAYHLHRVRAEAGRRRSEEILERFTELGVEVKDPWTGLLDFYTERDGEVAYLCWVETEDEVAHWHTLAGGFAAREPL